MKLSKLQRDIIAAEICPYCNGKTVRTNEEEIYKRQFKGRDIIRCENWPTCDAYVGCHDDGKPLGRLSDWALRIDKKKCHESLDVLWRQEYMKRQQVYRELSEYLGLPKELTHIGYFNKAYTRKARAWALEKFLEVTKK